jgi:glyoxylase-like metal-dependent hydrolase (beta-lactamase superfamily II)
VVDVLTLEVGDVRLTRVPYFDVALDPSAVGLTGQLVAEAGWAVPTWATEGGQVLVGQAIWVLESAGRVIVVDPCCAADPFLRSGPEALGHQDAVIDAMARAGLPPHRVDVVVLSHLDGIGMTALIDEDGRWRPMFPNARVVLTSTELSWLDQAAVVSGRSALRALIAAGVVDGVPTPFELTPEVSVHLVGGHSTGHAIVRVDSGDQHAVLLGHLALSPIHLTIVASTDMPPQHVDNGTAARTLDQLRAESATRGTSLIGPLWPYPGLVDPRASDGLPLRWRPDQRNSR